MIQSKTQYHSFREDATRLIEKAGHIFCLASICFQAQEKMDATLKEVKKAEEAITELEAQSELQNHGSHNTVVEIPGEGSRGLQKRYGSYGKGDGRGSPVSSCG